MRNDVYLQQLKFAPRVGIHRFPKLEPSTSMKPHQMIPFNGIMSEKNLSDKWFHFYVHDYQFNRLWNKPEKYFPYLMRCEGGISPDFSMLITMDEKEAVDNCRKNMELIIFYKNREYLSLSMSDGGILILINGHLTPSLKTVLFALPHRDV